MFECVGSRSCSRESQGVDGAADKQDLRLSQLTSEILSERKGLRERWDAFEQRCNNTFRQLEVEVTDLKEKHDTFCQLEAEVSDLKDKQQLAIQSSDPSASQIMTVQATLTTFEEKVVGCEGRMAEMTKTLQEMVMGVENKLEKTTSKGGELDTWLEERFAQLASTIPVKSSDSEAVSDDTNDRAHQNSLDPNGLTIVSLDEDPDSSSQINALKEEIAEFRAWRSKVDCVLFDFLPHEPEKSTDKNVLRDAGITVVEGSIQDSKNSLPEDEIGKGNEAPVASESQHTLKGILDDRHGSVRVYPLNESIYDAMVFLFGQTGLPPECSFLIFVGFIFNVVLQIATMIYCFELFTKQPFDGKLRGRFSYWRSAQGHSLANVDPFSGHSLTARVCGTDDSLTMAFNQQVSVEMVDEFLNQGQGSILCNIAIVLWSLCCCMELRNTLDLVMALMSIRCLNIDGDYHLTVSNYRRTFGVFVALTRVGVAIGLLLCGINWLAHTPTIRDLLLNASALGFVLEVDEVIFATFLPSLVMGVMSLVEPINLPRVTPGLIPVTTIFALGVFTIIVNVTYVDLLVTSMENVHSVLCAATTNVDFIAETNALGWLVFADTSPFPESDDDLEPDDKAVKAKLEIMELIINKDPQSWRYAYNVSQTSVDKSILHMRQLASTSTADLVRDAPCSDNVDTPRFGWVYAATGNQEFKVAESCADVKHHCRGASTSLAAINVRALCPDTCGCSDPTSGLFDLAADRFGCPKTNCKPAVAKVLASPSYECEDRDVLQSFSTSWSFMLSRMHDVNFINTSVFKNLSSMGCRALGYINNDKLRSQICSHPVYFGAGMMCPVSCGCLQGNRLSLPVPEDLDGYFCPHRSCLNRYQCNKDAASLKKEFDMIQEEIDALDCQSEITYYIRRTQTSVNWGTCRPSGREVSFEADVTTRAQCMQKATLACDTSSTCMGFAILSLQSYSLYTNFSCVHDQAAYLYVKQQALCNPTSCPEGLMCYDYTCGIKNDWEVCGETSKQYYCPTDHFDSITCHSKFCAATQEQCNNHGGVEFSSQPCSRTFSFDGVYSNSCCEDKWTPQNEEPCQVSITTAAGTATATGTGTAAEKWSPATGTLNGANIFMFGISGIRTFDKITWSDGCIWKARGCAQDSDVCLDNSPGWASWYTCANTEAKYCNLDAKDMQRCCPERCAVAPVCTEAACKNLTGRGNCIYPNEALRDFKRPS